MENASASMLFRYMLFRYVPPGFGNKDYIESFIVLIWRMIGAVLGIKQIHIPFVLQGPCVLDTLSVWLDRIFMLKTLNV